MTLVVWLVVKRRQSLTHNFWLPLGLYGIGLGLSTIASFRQAELDQSLPLGNWRGTIQILDRPSPNYVLAQPKSWSIPIAVFDTGHVLKAGQFYDTQLKLESIEPRQYPWQFDARGFWWQQQVYRTSQLIAAKPLEQKPPLLNWYHWRASLLASIDNSLPEGQDRAILKALLLGNREEITWQTRLQFKEASIMHAIAVSGMHLTLLFFSFSYLLPSVRHKPWLWWLIGAVVLAGVWAYQALTLGSPAVTRAAIMFSLWWVGKLSYQPFKFWHSWGLTAIIQMAFNPLIIYDIGFQLSFTALAGIVAFDPIWLKVWSPRRGYLRFLWQLFTSSTSVQVAVAPIMLYHFHQFGLWFWLHNLYAVPAMNLALVMGMLSLPFQILQAELFQSLLSLATIPIQFTIWALQSLQWLPSLGYFQLSTIDALVVLILIGLAYLFLTQLRPMYLILMLATVIVNLLASQLVPMRKIPIAACYRVRHAGNQIELRTVQNEWYASITKPLELRTYQQVLLPWMLYYGVDNLKTTLVTHDFESNYPKQLSPCQP